MSLKNLLNKAGKKAKRLITTPDMARILALTPTLNLTGTALPFPTQVEDFTLNDVQVQALTEIASGSGLLGAIGVGHGKSFIALLAGAAAGARKTVVLVEPGLVHAMMSQWQKLRKLYKGKGKGYEYFVNSLYVWDSPEVLEGGDKGKDKTILLPYSVLSSRENSDILSKIKPDFIFADEGQALASLASARGGRVQRYTEEHPNVKVAIVSATLTSKSLKDYAHLAYWALQEGSPLPLPTSKQELEVWSRCIDPRQRRENMPTSVDWRCMEALIEKWGGMSAETFRAIDEEGKGKREKTRAAFLNQFRNTRGVVKTIDSSASMSLNLKGFKLKSENKEYTDLVKGVRSGKVTEIEGMEIGEDDRHRVLKQLAAGFVYIPIWETEDGKPHKPYLRARGRWNRMVSMVTDLGVEGWDTEGQIKLRLKEGAVFVQAFGVSSASLRGLLKDWELEQDNGPVGNRTLWFDNNLMTYTMEKLHEVKKQTIVWFEHQAVGELLEQFLPVYGAGDTIPEDYNSHIAASISAHGKGNNLQKWSSNIILEVPAGGKTWEQLLGRTHRQGQESDSVEALVNQTFPEQGRAFKQAQDDAGYLEQTQGNKQKLLLCTKTNLPSV